MENNNHENKPPTVTFSYILIIKFLQKELPNLVCNLEFLRQTLWFWYLLLTLVLN